MIILGLGSNIGDRAAHLQAAVDALRPVFEELRLSAIVETPALLPKDAPPEWNIPFFNMAVCGELDVAPQALLAEIKAIEATLGRVDRGRWGPREIDIDILAMDTLVLDSRTLSIPHRELLNRKFALLPLAEIAPDWRFPREGKYQGITARELAKRLHD